MVGSDQRQFANVRRRPKKSVGCTLVIIVLLFWWAHRRFGPLLWLLTLLTVILAGTLALGWIAAWIGERFWAGPR